MASDTPEDTSVQFAQENEKAESHITSGDLAGAAKILVPLVDQDPSNWRAFNNIGIISWLQRDWEESFRMFKKACSLKPDYIDALFNLFDAALKLQRIPEARTFFDKALQEDPDNEEIKIITDAIDSQGEDIYQSQRALEIGIYNPRIDEAYKLLDEGKQLDAMRLFLQVNDEEGPNADALAGLGIVSFQQQKYEDAYALFLQSLKHNPVSPDTFLNLRDAAKKCNKVEEAKAIFEKYKKDIPALMNIDAEFQQT
jgi:tetratricopeptide (TPR) repeat protein